MAAFDFFKGASPFGGNSKIRSFPIKSSAAGFFYGEPVGTASGVLDGTSTLGSNPATTAVQGIALTGFKDANGVQWPAAAGQNPRTLIPVAIKLYQDEWVCHNFSTAGGGTLVAPTQAAVGGGATQAGLFFGTVTPSATDVRGTSTIANSWAVDTSQANKHFELVRVLDSLFRDISVSGGTGEYVVVRWLQTAQ